MNQGFYGFAAKDVVGFLWQGGLLSGSGVVRFLTGWRAAGPQSGINMWMGKVKAPESMFFDPRELDFAKDGLIHAVRVLGLQVHK